MTDLEVNLSMQPKTENQTRWLVELLNMPNIKRIQLRASEYPTDAFLKEEKYQVGHTLDKSLASMLTELPGMLGVKTPMEARQEKIEADGRHFGKCVAELTTGIEVRNIATVDPVQAMIDSMLNGWSE